MPASALLLWLAVVVAWPGFGGAAAAATAKLPADLGVLFIGAHPDDEAGNLSTFGQWHEYEGIRTGVITVTRGEGEPSVRRAAAERAGRPPRSIWCLSRPSPRRKPRPGSTESYRMGSIPAPPSTSAGYEPRWQDGKVAAEAPGIFVGIGRGLGCQYFFKL